MNRVSRVLFVALALTAFGSLTPAVEAADHSFGVGVGFFRTVDGLPSSSELDNIADDGYSYVFSYQYRPRGLFTFELAAEYYPDGYGGSTKAAITPEGFVLIGHGFYAGVGAGATYSDGLEDNLSDPFYMGRLGWDLSLLGAVELALHITYRFDEWDELKNVDVSTDNYTIGATLRF